MAVELAPVLHIEAAGICITLQLSAGADGQTIADIHISANNAKNGQICGGNISVNTARFPDKHVSFKIDIPLNGAINPYIFFPFDITLYGDIFVYNRIDFAVGGAARNLLADAVKHGGFPLE